MVSIDFRQKYRVTLFLMEPHTKRPLARRARAFYLSDILAPGSRHQREEQQDAALAVHHFPQDLPVRAGVTARSTVEGGMQIY